MTVSVHLSHIIKLPPLELPTSKTAGKENYIIAIHCPGVAATTKVGRKRCVSLFLKRRTWPLVPANASCVDASDSAFRLVPAGLGLECGNSTHGSLFDRAAANGGGDSRLHSGSSEGLATRAAKIEGKDWRRGFEGTCEEPGGHCCVCVCENKTETAREIECGI